MESLTSVLQIIKTLIVRLLSSKDLHSSDQVTSIVRVDINLFMLKSRSDV